MTFVLFTVAARLLPWLPRWLLTYLGVVAGALGYLAGRPARAAVMRNLAVVLPAVSDRNRRRIAVQVFVHGAWSYIELLCMTRVRPQSLPDAFPISGWEHLHAALTQGRGVIMITAHIGAPSLAGQRVALYGVPTMVAVERLDPPALHELVASRRAAFGWRMVPAGFSAAREILAALRRNEIVGMVCDRDVAGSGDRLCFFGKPTHVTTAAATFALRTGAVVLPSVAYRSKPFAGIARIEAPVEMPHTADSAADVREGTQRILARLETWIREHPEQWVVFTDVWPREVPADRVQGTGGSVSAL